MTFPRFNSISLPNNHLLFSFFPFGTALGASGSCVPPRGLCSAARSGAGEYAWVGCKGGLKSKNSILDVSENGIYPQQMVSFIGENDDERIGVWGSPFSDKSKYLRFGDGL